jgi:hypothetical protein
MLGPRGERRCSTAARGRGWGSLRAVLRGQSRSLIIVGDGHRDVHSLGVR